MKHLLEAVVILGVSASLAGCGGAGVSADAQEAPADPNFEAGQAMADPHEAGTHDADHALPDLPGGADLSGDFIGTDGQTNGAVMIAETPGGLLMRVDVTGIAHGFHGVHIHETGLCEPAEGFKTAGGHANPTSKEHGFLVAGGPHIGDFPNAYAHDEGHLRTDVFGAGTALSDIQDSDGFAVMIHSGADDYESQPSGDAGSRVACAAFPG